LKIWPKFGQSKVHSYLFVKVFVVMFFNSNVFFHHVSYIESLSKILRWNHNKKCIWMLMQNLNYRRMFILKVHYYMIGVCLLNFAPYYIFLFKLTILIHKYFCQIDDFTMRLWHFKKLHFVESP
jgi:hypothetical protein